MSVYDVIVVGAGIEGSATAWRLAQRQLKTLLIDQFPLPHTRGSSHGHTRQTRRLYPDRLYADMAQESGRGWTELELATGVPLFRKTGSLLTGPKTHRHMVECENMFRNSSHEHRVLNGNELKEAYPQFSFPDDTMGILDPNGGLLYANKCLLALWEQFRRLGGTVRDRNKMTDLQILGPDSVVVTTNEGQFKSKAVILCLGGWTKPLVKRLCGLDLDLRTLLISYYFGRESKPGAYAVESGTPTMNMYDADGYDYYAWPAYEYPGMVKLGIHTGVPGDPDNPNDVDHSVLNDLIRSFYGRTWPYLDDSFPVTERCIYTASKNGDFVIDTLPGYQNVAIAAGFSGHGFKFAPVVGNMLADMITGKKSQFASNRFKLEQHLATKGKL